MHRATKLFMMFFTFMEGQILYVFELNEQVGNLFLSFRVAVAKKFLLEIIPILSLELFDSE